jgi:CheY-like chemotaxis protein
VALSGYGQEDDVKAAASAGFDEHLTKPPEPDRLERLLTDPEPVIQNAPTSAGAAAEGERRD